MLGNGFTVDVISTILKGVRMTTKLIQYAVVFEPFEEEFNLRQARMWSNVDRPESDQTVRHTRYAQKEADKWNTGQIWISKQKTSTLVLSEKDKSILYINMTAMKI